MLEKKEKNRLLTSLWSVLLVIIVTGIYNLTIDTFWKSHRSIDEDFLNKKLSEITKHSDKNDAILRTMINEKADEDDIMNLIERVQATYEKVEKIDDRLYELVSKKKGY